MVRGSLLIAVIVALAGSSYAAMSFGNDGRFSRQKNGETGQETRCIAIHDVYSYRPGDKNLARALNSLASIREVRFDPKRNVPGAERSPAITAEGLRALKVTIVSGTCAGLGASKPNSSGGYAVASYGGCTSAGCTHPDPPEEWYHLMPGSKVTIATCHQAVDSNIYYVVEKYEKQGDGTWLMTYRSSERVVECPPM